jgi:hypothetical protein
LNVSLLDAAFDEHIPQLKTYKAGHFHRPMTIDTVPVLFEAQRRYPFEEIVDELERQIRPPMEVFAKAVQRDYLDLKIPFTSENATHSPHYPHALYLHFYQLSVSCQFSDDAHADYNRLELTVYLQQREATTYPSLTAHVSWLIDEESGGDWGLDIVHRSMMDGFDYAPHQLDLLQRALPLHFRSFREQILGKLSGELESSRYQRRK